MSAGIYAIRCLVSGNEYVGQSEDLNFRIADHKRKLRNGKHPNRNLRRAAVKYGPDAFEFIVLEIIDDLDLLDEREKYHAKARKARYNIAPPGCRVRRLYGKRRRYSDATARKVERVFHEMEAEGGVIMPSELARRVGRNINNVIAVLKDAPWWTEEHVRACHVERTHLGHEAQRATGFAGIRRSVERRRARGFPEIKAIHDRQAALGWPNLQKALLARAENGNPGPAKSAQVRREKAAARRARIIEMLRAAQSRDDLGTSTLSEIASATKMSEDTVYAVMRQFARHGFVEDCILGAVRPLKRRGSERDANDKQKVIAVFEEMARAGRIPAPSDIGRAIGLSSSKVTRILDANGMWTPELRHVVRAQSYQRALEARQNVTRSGYAPSTAERVAAAVASMKAEGRVPIPKEIAMLVGVGSHQVYVILKHADYWTTEDQRNVTLEVARRARAGRGKHRSAPPAQLPLFDA